LLLKKTVQGTVEASASALYQKMGYSHQDQKLALELKLILLISNSSCYVVEDMAMKFKHKPDSVSK
jgi:hypothetical protein